MRLDKKLRLIDFGAFARVLPSTQEMGLGTETGHLLVLKTTYKLTLKLLFGFGDKKLNGYDSDSKAT